MGEPSLHKMDWCVAERRNTNSLEPMVTGSPHTGGELGQVSPAMQPNGDSSSLQAHLHKWYDHESLP